MDLFEEFDQLLHVRRSGGGFTEGLQHDDFALDHFDVAVSHHYLLALLHGDILLRALLFL